MENNRRFVKLWLQLNGSHALSVALDSLYGADLKANYSLEFYTTCIEIYTEKKNKKKLSAIKEEMRLFGINEGELKFGEDNSKITFDRDRNLITQLIGSIKDINVNIVSSNVVKTATLYFDIQNSKNGLPDDSQSLSNEKLQLTFSPKDIINKKVTLNVSDKNIWTDKDFFVTVRVNEDFKGVLQLGGNIFALFKDTYYRNYFGEWTKYSGGEPSINVDVLVEK